MATRTNTIRATTFLIALAMVLLMAIGVQAIWVSQKAEGTGGLAVRQLVYTIAALGAFIISAVIPYPKIGQVAYPFFALSLALLVAVLFLPAVKGSHRWIDLGPIKAQPSEIAKLALIVLLAWYLRLGSHYRKLAGLIPPFMLTLVPMLLILREPDLGTALLFLPTLYVMLFMAGAKLSHLLGIVLVGTVLVLIPLPRPIDPATMSDQEIRDRKQLAYWTQTGPDGREYIVSAAPVSLIRHHHQIQRLAGWLSQGQNASPQGKGYQLRQSKIVLGSGMLAGRGDWEEGKIHFRRLPEDHTDFIFSIIGGQWGFIGCVGLLVLYAAIVVCGVEIAATTFDPFGRLLVVGVLGLLISQVFINVGMTMGLMPITGMTLPLVSYGGSSLVVNGAALGLLVNVGQRRPIRLSRRPFEHEDDVGYEPYRPLEKPLWRRNGQRRPSSPWPKDTPGP